MLAGAATSTSGSPGGAGPAGRIEGTASNRGRVSQVCRGGEPPRVGVRGSGPDLFAVVEALEIDELDVGGGGLAAQSGEEGRRRRKAAGGRPGARVRVRPAAPSSRRSPAVRRSWSRRRGGWSTRGRGSAGAGRESETARSAERYATPGRVALLDRPRPASTDSAGVPRSKRSAAAARRSARSWWRRRRWRPPPTGTRRGRADRVRRRAGGGPRAAAGG
jgi:hypothetical protein